MQVSDLMVTKLVTLTEEDTVSKALNFMHGNDINQIPIVDSEYTYIGMVFVRDLVENQPVPTTKLKHFVVRTPALSDKDDISRAVKLIINTGNRALPVISNNKLKGIISETDLLLSSDLGNATVDTVMSGAIVIDEYSTISNAISEMRSYNISRLPVINKDGSIRGMVNVLDLAKILSTPMERATKSPGEGTKAVIRDVKIKDVLRRSTTFELGTRINEIIESFKKADEVVIVGNEKPLGIITPKDILELTLEKSSQPTIEIANVEDDGTKREIIEQMTKFLSKIQARIEKVNSVIVYVEKRKTRNYTLRGRVFTSQRVYEGRSNGYDIITSVKELVENLERRITSDHEYRIKDKHHQEREGKMPPE